jgi:AcrR family transcriptional regulator
MARVPQDPQIRITAILDAAEYLFTAKGYSGTTICDIAKHMDVAQGMFYYYFKSKEEILESLLDRQMSYFICKVKEMVNTSITPSEKIGLLFQIVISNIHDKNEALLRIVQDEQNLHIRAKIARQSKIALTPLILKIIEEGCIAQEFSVAHPQISLEYILFTKEFLINTYNVTPKELLSPSLRMAEAMIEKILGAKEGTIHIILNKG